MNRGLTRDESCGKVRQAAILAAILCYRLGFRVGWQLSALLLHPFRLSELSQSF